MKELNIEWMHFETGRETCLRCSETGKTLDHVITCLKHELKYKGVEVTFRETLLPESQMAHSNEILFNNVPLEEILDEATSSENYCSSCTCLTGRETWCRTIEHEGKTYEEIPEELIRKAAFKAIGLI